MFKKRCQNCKKEYHHPYSGSKFCSHKCDGERKRKGIFRKCLNCSKLVWATPWHINHNFKRFCSKRCAKIGEFNNNYGKGCFGKKNGMWEGGKSFEPYPIVWTEALKKKIRERDEYKCAICEKWGNEVHHINYNKSDCRQKNLVTLCHSCHSKTNHRRKHWIKILKK